MARPMATRCRWPPDRLARTAVEIVGQVQGLGGGGDPPFLFGRIHLRHLQREGDVLAHRHMRIERIGLEHHGKTALGGRNLGGIAAIDLDHAGGDVFKACDQAQECGLAAAGRADEDDEFPVFDLQIQRWNDHGLAKGLGDVLE